MDEIAYSIQEMKNGDMHDGYFALGTILSILETIITEECEPINIHDDVSA